MPACVGALRKRACRCELQTCELRRDSSLSRMLERQRRWIVRSMMTSMHCLLSPANCDFCFICCLGFRHWNGCCTDPVMTWLADSIPHQSIHTRCTSFYMLLRLTWYCGHVSAFSMVRAGSFVITCRVTQCLNMTSNLLIWKRLILLNRANKSQANRSLLLWEMCRTDAAETHPCSIWMMFCARVLLVTSTNRARRNAHRSTLHEQKRINLVADVFDWTCFALPCKGAWFEWFLAERTCLRWAPSVPRMHHTYIAPINGIWHASYCRLQTK